MKVQYPGACARLYKSRKFSPFHPLLSLCCFLLFSHAAGAQTSRMQHPLRQPVHINPIQDKLEYEGFTIRLIPTVDGYYGYDILKGKQLVQHQLKSPLPNKPLDNREDAFKAAKQVVAAYQKTGHVPNAILPGLHPQPAASTIVNPSKH